MYPKSTLVSLYRTLYTIRVFETRCIKLYRQGLIRGYFHPYLGEEAIATGACAALEPRDFIVSTHRGHGHCIARGADLGRMMAELLGREAGYCGGRGGSMHIADFATGNLGANGIVGAGLPIGVGAALGAKIRGDDSVTVVFFSDGAANNGVFAEAMNLAAIWDLPVVFMLENNQYAVSTPIESVSRDPDLYRRGLGYDVESLLIDGNDVLEVHATTAEAVAKCRRGEGPVLIEAKTYRHLGHHVNDPGLYMPKDRLAHYRAKDPVSMGAQQLRELGPATPAEVESIRAEVEAEIEAAIAFAIASPAPDLMQFLAATEGL
jgi:acetoin:2,6-dichlorophenolindophenol oxidoreductase subunit alpha